jgi:hypothetical protein
MEFPSEAYNAEKPRAVFLALVTSLPAEEQHQWLQRWALAKRAEDTVREYQDGLKRERFAQRLEEARAGV